MSLMSPLKVSLLSNLLTRGLYESGETGKDGLDKSVKLLNAISGDLIRNLTGYEDAVTSLAFVSDDMLASGAVEKTIKLWNTSSGDLIRTFSSHVDTVT